MFLRILTHRLTWISIGLIALSLLIWWVGPLIAFGDHHPLDSIGARLIWIIGLFVLAGGLLLLGYWRRRRANAALVGGLKGGASLADKESEVLGKRFTEALGLLEQTARQSGKRTLFSRSQYLYDMPWYVFIGAPGSGKTTALLNADLTFPLAGKMGQAAIKGVGGTRNCDWWFTDEAVLIDTAGRYTLQQSDETVDASAWNKFLDLLKAARPRRPLNGVLLTVSVQDLLQSTPADRKEHAMRLRMRLQELQARLGVRPPIYVLLTKMDLVAGFNETFQEMGKEERDQVWGFSFPYDPRVVDSPMQEFSSEFAALDKRLRDRLIDRLQAEPDTLKRAAIFSFPQQFGSLKGVLGSFLEQVFEGGGSLEERALLRGIYFTSGTQEGTPIDRVLGTLARTFGVDGRSASLAAGRGRSYFLSRLLKEVVFKEQGLVGENRQAESRRRRGRMFASAAIGVVSLAMLGAWAVSANRNRAYVDEVAQRAPGLKATVDALAPATNGQDMAAVKQALDSVEQGAQSPSFDVNNPPLLYGLGLSQASYLTAGAQIGYGHLLDHALMPRVVQRLEERLRAANRDNLELAYEALKAYLMIYEPSHFDAEALKSWVTLDWDTNLANTMNAQQRAELGTHLDDALARGAPPTTAPMDKALVASVREMLVAYPLEYRIFSRLKRSGVGRDLPEFSVAGAAGPNATQVFERASGQPLTKGIPGLFTRDGYFKAFKPAVPKVAQQLADEDGWVLGRAGAGSGTNAAKAAVTGDEAVINGVRRLYLQEYIKVWDQYLADVRMVKLGGLDRSLNVARYLTAPDSPLAAYMRGIDRETQLGAAAQAAADRGNTANRVLDKAAKAKSELAALTGASPVGESSANGLLESMVDDHFAAIHRLVSGQPAPIDDVTKQFGEVLLQLTAIDAAQKSKSPPPPAAGAAAAKAAAAVQPEPIKSMLEDLIDAGANQSRSAERQSLTGDFKPIAEQCVRTIAGRYPFAPGARADVLPDDFGQMFGVGGQLDTFYQARLASQVDTGSTPWTFKPLPDGTRPTGGAALADFQRAAKIRDAFFRAGGKTPGFKVDVRVVDMADGLKELSLDIDGQVYKFTAGNTTAQTLSWPSTKVASQIRLEGAPGGAVQTFDGPWALFRLFGQFEVQPSPQPEKFTVVLVVDGKRARMEVTSSSAINPLRMRELAAFRCPDGL
jgi:type VI secretion system protein ImpL